MLLRMCSFFVCIARIVHQEHACVYVLHAMTMQPCLSELCAHTKESIEARN